MLYLWQFPHFFALAWRGRHDYKAGGHVMVPCLDASGTMTAHLIQRCVRICARVRCVAFRLSRCFPLNSSRTTTNHATTDTGTNNNSMVQS